MSNEKKKPPIFGYCPAGCKWETIHRSEFEQSATYINVPLDEDGRAYLKQGQKYKIFVNDHSEDYWNCPLSFVFSDSISGTTTHTIKIPHNDEYANSFVFRFLDAIINDDGTTITIIYEIDGVRYSETVVGEGNVSLLEERCLIVVANKVSKYNSDASIEIDVEGSGTKNYIGSILQEAIYYNTNPVDAVDFAESERQKSETNGEIVHKNELANYYTKDETYSQKEVDNIISGSVDLTNYAKKDLSNVAYPTNTLGSRTSGAGDRVIETYIASDGKTWSRKWASGWKECGGITMSSGGSVPTTVTYPIAFSNTYYTISIQPQALSINNSVSTTKITSGSKTVSSFGFVVAYINKSSQNYVDTTLEMGYYCCGY